MRHALEKTSKDIELTKELKTIFKKFKDEGILLVQRLLSDEVMELLEKITDYYLKGEDK